MAGTPEEPGIVRLAVDQIFGHIKSHPQQQFAIKFSCMEIYEEKIFDLLNDRKPVILMSDPLLPYMDVFNPRFYSLALGDSDVGPEEEEACL